MKRVFYSFGGVTLAVLLAARHHSNCVSGWAEGAMFVRSFSIALRSSGRCSMLSAFKQSP